jgi:hypothetical protein
MKRYAADDKSQIQNLKFQISTNKLKSKLNSRITFMFGILNLFVIWCFVFGACRIVLVLNEDDK